MAGLAVRVSRGLSGLVTAALVTLAVAACAAPAGGGGTAPPTASTAAPSSTAASGVPSGTATPSPTASSAGCPAGGTVPDGAATAPTADLDGDRRADTLWLSGGPTRTLGVRTASGAVLSTRFSSGSPIAAKALGQRLADGSAVVLLDTGRSVALYAVVDCELVPTRNVQGGQYTFDLGFTGYGTGVGCADVGNGLQLVGLNAAPSASGTTFEVTRTPIELQDRGASARNGRTEVLAKDVPDDDPAVTQARTVTCGDAPPPVAEPQS
ncbi:hypothetical protein [Georgenia soli]|uniref:hypothetical protein n=1 Tax=Georgenia soli TaxID=638953 RepID=UPI00117B087F|nr:hypothetical protein [Georgenia soli]